MAGHSQFKNIMHRKGRQDAARSKLFSKLAREIITAARQGGGDPDANYRLRMAVDKAKAPVTQAIDEKRGNLQRWQELGGLTGRILFAVLLVYVASRVLIRIFLLPGVVLFPVAYLVLYQGDYTVFAPRAIATWEARSPRRNAKNRRSPRRTCTSGIPVCRPARTARSRTRARAGASGRTTTRSSSPSAGSASGARCSPPPR